MVLLDTKRQKSENPVKELTWMREKLRNTYAQYFDRFEPTDYLTSKSKLFLTSHR